MGVFVTSKAEGNTTRHRVFEQVYGSWRIITLCPMLLGIMCWLLNRVLLPLLLYPWGGGQGYKEGTESVTILILIGSLYQTCQIYKIYI
jgi:hypothetical protein